VSKRKIMSDVETINYYRDFLNGYGDSFSFFKTEYDGTFAKKRRAPRKKRVRSPEKTATAFAALLTNSGFKKELSVVERGTHMAKLGSIEERQAERQKAIDDSPDSPPPKRLCGVCGDAYCPWSD
jgi:hypothetical protein